MTDDEVNESLRKLRLYVDHPYTDSDTIVLNSMLVVLTAGDISAALDLIASQRERIAELDKVIAGYHRNSWCWPVDDGETPYDYPREWAEYELDHTKGPQVVQFSWAGRLPDTWAAFVWSGDEDDGEWAVTEFPTEAAARAFTGAQSDD